MSHWGRAYEQGYRDAAKKLLDTPEEVEAFMGSIGREKDGGPSIYVIAFRCCGGVDAHVAGCRR